MASSIREYRSEDVWVESVGSTFRVGMSLESIKMLRDSAFIELPMLGAIKAGDPLLHIETSKVAHEISSPLSGTVREVNQAFLESQTLKEGDNWIAVIERSE